MSEELPDVLKDTRDLIVIGKTDNDSYTYAAKPTRGTMGMLYQKWPQMGASKEIPNFNELWPKKGNGISGLNFPQSLIYEVEVLRPNGLWFPGFLESLVLHERLGPTLFDDSYVRYLGIALLNEKGEDEEVARPIIFRARELGFEPPLLISYRDLTYRRNEESRLGIDVSLVEEPKTIIPIDKEEFAGIRRKFPFPDFFFALCPSEMAAAQISLTFDPNDYMAYSYPNLKSNHPVSNGFLYWVCGEANEDTLRKAHSGVMRRRSLWLQEQEKGIERLMQRIGQLRTDLSAEEANFELSLGKDFPRFKE